QPEDEDQDPASRRTSNAVGYYPPSRALVVKGTSRVQDRLSGGILNPRAPAGAGGMGRLDPQNREDALAKRINNKELRDQAKDVIVKKAPKDPKGDNASQVAAATNLDPRTIWQEKLEQRPVNDPG